LRALLLEGANRVVTSELTRIEVASAVHAAARCGVTRDARQADVAEAMGLPVR
jgi:hypothetical protein